MSEGNEGKEIQYRSFNQKWHVFLVTYGIFNVLFFVSNNAIIGNLYVSFSRLYIKDFSMDGSDLSILVNLLTMPLFAILLVVNIAVILVSELIAVRLSKSAYMKSVVLDEAKARLLPFLPSDPVFHLPVPLFQGEEGHRNRFG